MEVEEFYTEVARLLQTENLYRKAPAYMRRWGDRTPGNGRYPGHGLVRVYAEDVIHVHLHSISIMKTFTSFEDALVCIAGVLRA